MALVSSTGIVSILSLFHITLGWLFLSSPRTISNQGLVLILGQAMGMPHTRTFETPSQPLAFLAYMLICLGISDLFSLSGPDHPVHLHWSTQAPLRMFFSIGLTVYTFVFSPSGPLYGNKNSHDVLMHSGSSAHASKYIPSSWGGDMLKNRVFFTFVFLETLCWFWVFVTLRDERANLQRRRRNEHEE